MRSTPIRLLGQPKLMCGSVRRTCSESSVRTWFEAGLGTTPPVPVNPKPLNVTWPPSAVVTACATSSSSSAMSIRGAFSAAHPVPVVDVALRQSVSPVEVVVVVSGFTQ